MKVTVQTASLNLVTKQLKAVALAVGRVTRFMLSWPRLCSRELSPATKAKSSAVKQALAAPSL